MSPEVIGEQGHDFQSDWWSLGIVLYELASGTPPFHSNDLEAMADNIRFGDMPTKNYFSEVFEDLIQRLTAKQPERRLGTGGAAQIKKHPFFKNVKWDAVFNKQMKPPIVPAKRASNISRDKQEDGEVNPYALLNCNFESEFYDRDIMMWKEQTNSKKNSLVPSEQPSESHNSCHLSNFTYDKQLIGQQYRLEDGGRN